MAIRLYALAALLLVGVVLGTPRAARADDPALFSIEGGLFDLEAHRKQEAEGRLEYRFGYGLFETDGVFKGFHPLLGIMGNTADAFFGYGGLAAPFAFDNDRWEFVPSAGIGGYHPGNGIFLGGTFEFHLGLAGSYAIAPNMRVGVAIDHISNATTHRLNPGVNSVLLTWAFAFDGP